MVVLSKHYKLIPETGNNLFVASTPRMLHRAYANKTCYGALVDDEEAPWYVREIAKYEQSAANDEMDDDIVWERSKLANPYQGKGDGKRMMFHQAYAKRSPIAGHGAQLTGDCVSWAIRLILELLRIQNIQHGIWEEWYMRQATAGIYSGRGHNGQGASPSRLSAYAIKIGTIFEQLYELNGKTYDFRKYQSYVKWGMQRGRIGIPDDLKAESSKYHARTWRIIKSPQGMRDAWAAGEELGGCQMHCGSGIGVASHGDPVSKLSGGWNHDMGLTGFDDTKEFHNQCVYAWDQSWGNWNRLSNVPAPWKPLLQGMFFLAESSMKRALQGEMCAFFGFDGKPAPPSNVLY